MSQDLIPSGIWIRLFLPDSEPVLGFTYYDREAGFSAKDNPDPGSTVVGQTVRLPYAWCPWEPLSEEEQRELQLPRTPPWLELYGEQPPKGMLWGYWRDHSLLSGRFHKEYPDDLQVYVHDGGPRFTTVPPEYVWVRVTGVITTPFADVFVGTVLNQPYNLRSVSIYDSIKFLVPSGFEFPIMVTERYLSERGQWKISFCPHCNLSEMFDVPSDFVRRVFPDVPAGDSVGRMTFTLFCPACGGVMVVSPRESEDDPYVYFVGEKGEPRAPFSTSQGVSAKPRRTWWKFWQH